MTNWKTTRDATHNHGDGWGFWLLDKDMEPLCSLAGMQSVTLSEEVNATTVCKIEMRGDHPAVALLLPLANLDPAAPGMTWNALVDDAQWIMAEGPRGAVERLVFRVARITDRAETQTPGVVTVEAKSLYRYVEKIACRADPNNPLWAQLRYHDFRAGDSLRVIKEYLMVNLMKDFQPRAITGWDLWAASNWSNLNPDLWAAIVNPTHASTSTQHAVLDARFDMASELFAETLAAAGLMLTVDLWLEGDDQPFSTHTTLRRPTLIVDVKTRQFDTSTTGTALDFFRGLVRSFSQENNAPAIGLGTTPATAAGRLPWVVWRPEHMAGIISDFTVVKSEDSRVIVGGRSPEVINKLLGAGSKAIFQGLAAGLAAIFPPFAPLIVAAGLFLGEVIGESMKDKLFAWAQFEHAVRRAAHGRFAYREQVGAGDGWTLSALQQGFSMLQQGAGMINVGFEVGEVSPYRWGRDYRVGDQQGVVHRGVVFSTYVSAVTLTWTQATGWRETVSLGDPRAIESWTKAYARSIKAISNKANRLATVVM
ncbi:hypothetical protein [Corynebacterium lipophiloflavum]|uniref:Gp28/Gp37-like domain-containing protein n=1 Tax=Corynebacterium lipophiloflavum (strain ATCC 700352 / DSM 44291 / CCUG 37336 / JCM 10383 / DMMZ 1944) TaxID=525263 RepID=C0XU20_CORLD|nr:hypothetical protein [Corynebacterium lipophiloflavum]EEI16246.1 hypothetical protein HMPREF0298_1940 [Corynebacterium lipophiloflavum DSM 44291]